MWAELPGVGRYILGAVMSQAFGLVFDPYVLWVILASSLFGLFVGAIPGLTLREMHESALCCGSAGVYNITQPALSAKLDREGGASGENVMLCTNPSRSFLNFAASLPIRKSCWEKIGFRECADTSSSSNTSARSSARVPSGASEPLKPTTPPVGDNGFVTIAAEQFGTNIRATVAISIAALSMPAVMMTKETVNRAYETTLAEGLKFERRVFHSMFALEDQKEGMAAFAEKRKASFKNR